LGPGGTAFDTTWRVSRATLCEEDFPVAAPEIDDVLLNGSDTDATINSPSPPGNDVDVTGSNLLGATPTLSCPGYTFNNIVNTINTSTHAAWTFDATGSAAGSGISFNITLCNGPDCSEWLVPIADSP